MNRDQMFHSRKCDYCGGKDGKGKDVYETFQSALDAAEYIEENREVYLDIYRCPHGNGWHLTKSKEPTKIAERKETLFQNNNIPLKSSDRSWEYVNAACEAEKENHHKTNVVPHKTTGKDNPIIKRDCPSQASAKELSGKVMEVVKNVNVEKIFKINLQNAFCASMVKNILDGTVNQITVYVENNNHIESYTILIPEKVSQNTKIVKGNEIKLRIVGKSINGIPVWCCDKIIP